MMIRKIVAIFIAVAGTVLPCLLAGAMVGVFFIPSFWYWTLGIAVLALCYIILDRVHLRDHHCLCPRPPLWDDL